MNDRWIKLAFMLAALSDEWASADEERRHALEGLPYDDRNPDQEQADREQLLSVVSVVGRSDRI